MFKKPILFPQHGDFLNFCRAINETVRRVRSCSCVQRRLAIIVRLVDYRTHIKECLHNRLVVSRLQRRLLRFIYSFSLLHVIVEEHAHARGEDKGARNTPQRASMSTVSATLTASLGRSCWFSPNIPAMRALARPFTTGARGRLAPFSHSSTIELHGRCSSCPVVRSQTPSWQPDASPMAGYLDAPSPGFASIDEALAEVAAGRFVVVLDDEDRENEGDLVGAANLMTQESLHFMIRHTSGLICVSVDGDTADRLDLPLMVPCDENEDAMSTAFTVSCDLVKSTTGISADERAATIARLGDLGARSDEFARPGHVFPLRSREGGVLKRAGHTEAAYDLSVLAGCSPAGVLCEIVNDSDGNMARLPQLREFSKKYGLKMVLISDLVRYRRNRQALVERSASARIPTNHGKFTAVSYRSKKDDIEHVAFVYGDDLDAVSGDNVLVRVHSECLTGDIFHSTRCDCGDQLDMAMKKVAAEGRGVIVYLRGQEGRGIGLGHKLRAYNLQDKGRDTVQANEDLGLPVDSREYGVGAQILQDLGVRTVRLMTNNPAKYNGLKGFGLTIVNRVPLCAPITLDNMRYIETKRAKMGHAFLDESDGLKSVPTEEDGIEDIPAMDASEEVVPC